MAGHDFKYDKALKETPEFQTLYNKWVWIRKRKYSVDFECFLDFYHWSLSSGYWVGAILKRLNDSKPYSPENCVWVHPSIERPSWSEDEMEMISKWNSVVNRIRVHFGMEPFPEKGDRKK